MDEEEFKKQSEWIKKEKKRLKRENAKLRAKLTAFSNSKNSTVKIEKINLN